MRVVLTARAESDLEAIADWIAQDNPSRALTFVRELRDCCAGLAQYPTRFQLVDRYAPRPVRRRVYGNYLIFYEVRADVVNVVRVLHGARDYDPLIEADDRG